VSTIKVDTIQSSGGGAVTLTNQHAAKAWINFNGTGTIATRDSFNVGSITDNSTGTYTVNYTNSFSDADYSPTTGAGGSGYTDRLLTLSVLAAGSLNVVENSVDSSQDVLICTAHSLGDLA